MLVFYFYGIIMYMCAHKYSPLPHAPSIPSVLLFPVTRTTHLPCYIVVIRYIQSFERVRERAAGRRRRRRRHAGGALLRTPENCSSRGERLTSLRGAWSTFILAFLSLCLCGFVLCLPLFFGLILHRAPFLGASEGVALEGEAFRGFALLALPATLLRLRRRVRCRPGAPPSHQRRARFRVCAQELAAQRLGAAVRPHTSQH